MEVILNNSRTQFVETCLALNIHPGEQVWELWQAAERHAMETATNGQVRGLLQELCGKVTTYEHSYGQAREEALADYGNTFSKVAAQLSVKAPK